MRATYARLCEARRIELSQKELTCGEHDALIEITACGICRGDVRAFINTTSVVEKFGHEPVGRVVAVGEQATRVAVGDTVAGALSGSFATHVVAHENELYRMPDSLGAHGCLAEPLKCVTTVVRAAALEFMDNVVVVGCGFMGLAAIAALARSAPRELVAVDPVPSRRQLALELGATEALEPTHARDAVARLTEGRGADASIEFAGTAEAAALACQLTRKRGRVVVAGGMSPAGNVYSTSLTVHFVPPAFASDEPDDFRRTIDAMARGQFPLDRLVTHRFMLSQIQGAFEMISIGDSSYVKGIVINDLSTSKQDV